MWCDIGMRYWLIVIFIVVFRRATRPKNQQQEYDGDLVLWNMTGLWLSIQLGMSSHPNWRSHKIPTVTHSIIFQRGCFTTSHILWGDSLKFRPYIYRPVIYGMYLQFHSGCCCMAIDNRKISYKWKFQWEQKLEMDGQWAKHLPVVDFGSLGNKKT